MMKREEIASWLEKRIRDGPSYGLRAPYYFTPQEGREIIDALREPKHRGFPATDETDVGVLQRSLEYQRKLCDDLIRKQGTEREQFRRQAFLAALTVVPGGGDYGEFAPSQWADDAKVMADAATAAVFGAADEAVDAD